MIGNTTRHNLRKGQEGSILLTFAVSIVALFCFAVVAIDGAILMTTKNQLQCAADAAALAEVLFRVQRDDDVSAFARAGRLWVAPVADVFAQKPHPHEPVEMAARRRDPGGDGVGIIEDVHVDVEPGLEEQEVQRLCQILAFHLGQVQGLFDDAVADDPREPDPDRINYLSLPEMTDQLLDTVLDLFSMHVP